MNPAQPSSDLASSASSTSPSAASPNNLPAADQLPPVQPPSASFIMQLFLVPGLIVAAVVGVWALFGKISSSEQDWRQLISELRSTNEHRRWRGANALAQVLRADVDLKDKGQNLAGNEQIAKELSSLLDELLLQKTKDPELVTNQSFVVRTLGWLDSEDVVCPSLIKAMQPEVDTLVRADAIRSVAQMASRKIDIKSKFKHSETIEQVITVSRDSEPLIRQVSAFTLGLLEGDAVDQQLKVMVGDSEANTRTNAAIALTRRQLPDGIPVLIDVLKVTGTTVDPSGMSGKTDGEKRNQAAAQEKANAMAGMNAFRALRELTAMLDDTQRQQAVVECQRLAKESPYLPLRAEAELTVKALNKASGR